MHLLSSTTLIQHRYHVVRLIGQGGMGAVYQALDQRLNILVALKQTMIGDARFNAAFEREAQLLAALRHPTLPRVIDHFVEADGQFLVMEYVSGDDLATLLEQRQTPCSSADVREWSTQLLRVLTYLHSRQPTIIHRDIKPANLKLNDEGELFLLDFGLAKGAIAHTQTMNARSMIGYSPQYAPLEQIQGSGTDPRSDLYALAATLHHLLAGTPPADSLARAAAVLTGQPDPLQAAHELNPQVPVAVGEALRNAMALNPAARPASAKAMRDELAVAWQTTAAMPSASVSPLQAPTNGAYALTTPTAAEMPWVVAPSPATAPTPMRSPTSTAPAPVPAAVGATVVISPPVDVQVTQTPDLSSQTFSEVFEGLFVTSTTSELHQQDETLPPMMKTFLICASVALVLFLFFIISLAGL